MRPGSRSTLNIIKDSQGKLVNNKFQNKLKQRNSRPDRIL